MAPNMINKTALRAEQQSAIGAKLTTSPVSRGDAGHQGVEYLRVS